MWMKREGLWGFERKRWRLFCQGLDIADLNELPAEAAFDAEVALSDGVIKRGANADDVAVLSVYG